ncbi:hypothetical protein HN51_023697 [Arachis hypogaea]|uniref:FRIGIDA-like protein n=1 Tax=Arachis hypogaea TaxID=3818 RepID=A0A445C374_ARAHY|nr:FRIGIDA-like protein 1 [Arachis hypogaea]QHO26627.1 FRIGIDA-like protein [Arachis hypogaea]RYR45385.1 hypothetical protein Ahy_A07g031222 [Arachis hypogaea]
MATLKTISAALELVDSKKQNLKKAFDDLLHSHSQLFSSSSSSSPPSLPLPLSWHQLDSHFTSLHDSLSQRFLHLQSLESQQQTKNPNPNPNLNNPNPNEPSPSPSSSDQNPKVTHFPSLPNDPSSSSDPIRTTENVPSGAKSHAEALCALCKSMNGKALRDYIGENMRDKAVIKAELRTALKLAPDPADMVLASMDGIFGGEVAARYTLEMKKMKRSCNVLFQQLRAVGPNLSDKVKKKAKKIADDWKGSLVSENGAGGDAVGAMAFLHFAAAYSLLPELTLNELATFSAMAAANDELPELYQIIGLTEKVPALVQKLIDKGKHILAVKYVFEFNLTDKIQPVPILEAYLSESQKLARRLSEEGKSMGEITAREIHALKSVIKVIENHNLDAEYPRAGLEQRIEQLKKQKPNVKHSTPAFARKPPQHKQQHSGNKRPRMSAPAGPAAVLNNVNSAGSTIHQYQQPHFHSTGLLPENSNPYMRATPYGMVAPAPSISPYQGASTGPYGLAGVPMGPSVNPGQSGSHLNSSEPHVPSGYYDGTASAYGGYGLQHYYQPSYPQ